ncbi:hypothetical protein TrLO_g9787 [Triparma laevis f. longispina]|nr:hypothetical protein TrLO_g9787 [Triparma laevis f. longispina]
MKKGYGMAGPSKSLGVDAYLERNQTVRNLIQKEDEEEEEGGKGVADGPKTVCKKNVTKMRDTDLTQELWGNEDDDNGIREKEAPHASSSLQDFDDSPEEKIDAEKHSINHCASSMEFIENPVATHDSSLEKDRAFNHQNSENQKQSKGCCTIS